MENLIYDFSLVYPVAIFARPDFSGIFRDHVSSLVFIPARIERAIAERAILKPVMAGKISAVFV